MRVRNEPISVRVSPDCAPTQFIWRARLWRVLAVQRSGRGGRLWDDQVRRARGQDAATRWSNELGEPGPPREPSCQTVTCSATARWRVRRLSARCRCASTNWPVGAPTGDCER